MMTRTPCSLTVETCDCFNGQVTEDGQPKARLNFSLPTGGTVGAISIALTIAGESLNNATAIVTPAATDNYFNVSGAAYIDVPRGCCVNVALENTSTQAVSVANTNVIATREA